jgi:hypothetical protein
MCFKRKPIVWEHSNKVALLFGINNYPGGENDLNGCLNDLLLVESKLPDFQIRKFVNSQVTVRCFTEQLQYAIDNAIPGDVIYVHYSGHGSYVKDKSGDEIDGYDECLYLHDGPLIDDVTSAILSTIKEGVHVTLGLDCCYYGGGLKDMERPKVRFMPPKRHTPHHTRVKRAFREGGMYYVVLSGCMENETSADAEINGIWNGAFTYYQMNKLSRDLTNKKWMDKINIYLPNKNFDQTPTIEGNEELQNILVLT